MRAYCKEVGIEYQDSMVNWSPITPEQREVFTILLDKPGGDDLIGRPISLERNIVFYVNQL